MSYSQVSSHRSMVFDEYRNSLYAQAIHRLVTPDSVVLDLGAGLGVLGLIAAKAGAKKVYLVEPEPVVQLAAEIAKANGLDDRITVIQGRIEDVELPEQVDLIISVFTGKLLYSEDLLPSLYFARDRYLKPGGMLIPDMAELMLAPLSAPELHDKYIGCWSRPSRDSDYSYARRFAANEIIWLDRDEAKFEQLGDEVVIAAADLMTDTSTDCQGKAGCRIQMNGLCHGLLGWIRIRLGNQWLSSHPAEPEVHWGPVMLPIDPPLPLQQGEEISLGLHRPVGGDWTWTVEATSGARRHSSFLSRTDGARQLQKIAPDYHPKLGSSGEDMLRILEMMQAGASNQEIAQALVDARPGAFRDVGEAMQLVQKTVLRHAK
jgi:SAM-dependent methyltransferase